MAKCCDALRFHLGRLGKTVFQEIQRAVTGKENMQQFHVMISFDISSSKM